MSSSQAISKIQRLSEVKCREWAERPTINPITGKSIIIDGPTYNALKERCLRYNITLPDAAAGIFSRGNSSADPAPAANISNAATTVSSAASSASVETKNLTAGWKRPRPTRERDAMAIVELIGKQIASSIKTLVTAQNADPVNGLKRVKIIKLFKNLPYYRPYIDSINNEEIFNTPYESVRFSRIRYLLENNAFKSYRIGAYTSERLMRLVDPSAPKVLVMLHKVFTFINSLIAQDNTGPYRINSNAIAREILAAIRPHLAEAQRKVDNLNIALVMRRVSQNMQAPDANELGANITGLMLARRRV